jgi:HK97 family phage major capsid protein
MPKAIAEMTAQELLDERNNAVHEMKTLKGKADSREEGKRDFTAAEDEEWNSWQKKYAEFDSAYKGKAKAEERSKWLADRESEGGEKSRERKSGGKWQADQEAQEKMSRWTPIKDYDASCKFARYNERQLTYNQQGRGSADYTKAFKSYLKTGDDSIMKPFGGLAVPDQSLQQSDDDVRGGYMIPSEQFMEGLLRNVDDATWIWRNSRVIVVSQAQSLGIRKLTAKMRCWAKGAELSDAFDNEDDSIRFGKKNLTPSYYTGAARISRDLLRVSVMDHEQLVYSEFARDLAELIEQEDISGTGVGGPLGVLVASADGISTARDFSTDTTSTTFKFETFIGAKYALKQQYRNRARWMLNRVKIRDAMKLRSDSGAGAGTGDFLWQPAVRAGEPDTICGLPVDENEWFPSATGSGTYFGLLAVWEYYVHAIALDMEILRLVETRAARNQVEYVGRCKIDGMPILEEAFVRLKYA